MELLRTLGRTFVATFQAFLERCCWWCQKDYDN